MNRTGWRLILGVLSRNWHTHVRVAHDMGIAKCGLCGWVVTWPAFGRVDDTGWVTGVPLGWEIDFYVRQHWLNEHGVML